MAWVASPEVLLPHLHLCSNGGCLSVPRGVTIRTRNTLRIYLVGLSDHLCFFKKKNVRGELKSYLSKDYMPGSRGYIKYDTSFKKYEYFYKNKISHIIQKLL